MKNEAIEHAIVYSLAWVQEELPKLRAFQTLLRDRRRGLSVQACEGLASVLTGTLQTLEGMRDELQAADAHLEPDAPPPVEGERILPFPGAGA